MDCNWSQAIAINYFFSQPPFFETFSSYFFSFSGFSPPVWGLFSFISFFLLNSKFWLCVTNARPVVAMPPAPAVLRAGACHLRAIGSVGWPEPVEKDLHKLFDPLFNSTAKTCWAKSTESYWFMTCQSVGITPKTRHDDHHVEFEVTSRVLASAISLHEPLLTQRHCVGRYLRRRNACAEGFASTLVFGSPLTVGPNIDRWKSAAPINGNLWRLVIPARSGDL